MSNGWYRSQSSPGDQREAGSSNPGAYGVDQMAVMLHWQHPTHLKRCGNVDRLNASRAVPLTNTAVNNSTACAVWAGSGDTPDLK